MKKDKLVFSNLRNAMAAIQAQRSSEVQGHTWEIMVERYGVAILFAEIASITGRLESLIWHGSDYLREEQLDRGLDLCIDLGNYAEFLYLSLVKRRKELKLQEKRDDDVPTTGLDSALTLKGPE